MAPLLGSSHPTYDQAWGAGAHRHLAVAHRGWGRKVGRDRMGRGGWLWYRDHTSPWAPAACVGRAVRQRDLRGTGGHTGVGRVRREVVGTPNVRSGVLAHTTRPIEQQRGLDNVNFG